MSHPSPEDVSKDKQKKPRHRHSPMQLAALNKLFEQNEHPSLDLRSSLADRLGMETKTVNAWFQNKRASSKRRTRGVSYEQPPINSFVQSPSFTNSLRHHPDLNDVYEDDYTICDKPSSSASVLCTDLRSCNIHPDLHPEATVNSIPRQTTFGRRESEEHKRFNMHAGSDQRQFSAERGGTNPSWYRNECNSFGVANEDGRLVLKAESLRRSRINSMHPSSIDFPSFPQPVCASPTVSRGPRSPSISPSLDWRLSRRSSFNPYGNLSSIRGSRRSRPEPYQLDALKHLFMKTASPSIEERNALALEIGMDIGKVTNWFRNLRQTARRRKRTSSADEDDFESYHPSVSASASRSVSPSFRSSCSFSSMDLDGDDDFMNEMHSDGGSDEEYQEILTPPPEAVRTPPVATAPPSSSSSRISISQLTFSTDPTPHAGIEKVSVTRHSPGVAIEDALLLLSFHLKLREVH